MQPCDLSNAEFLTQCAYAVEIVRPVLRIHDEAGQNLVVGMGPDAIGAAGRARAFHHAVSNLSVLGDLAERLALHPELLTVLQHLERGDDVRIAVTMNSVTSASQTDSTDEAALAARVA